MSLGLGTFKGRVIDNLRRLFPGPWKYMGDGRWDCPTFSVQAEAHSAPLYDSDERQRTMYRRSDTREIVLRGRYWTP